MRLTHLSLLVMPVAQMSFSLSFGDLPLELRVGIFKKAAGYAFDNFVLNFHPKLHASLAGWKKIHEITSPDHEMAALRRGDDDDSDKPVIIHQWYTTVSPGRKRWECISFRSVSTSSIVFKNYERERLEGKDWEECLVANQQGDS
jgi:hypothetical protein